VKTRGFPVPTRALPPLLGTVIVLIAWEAVAHSSGVGWVQALGALVAGFLVVGLVLPAVFTLRGTVRVTSNPHDAAVGREISLEVETSTPLKVRPIEPQGPAVLCALDGNRSLSAIPDRRGVEDSCLLEVSSAAPFGLMWWSKKIRVDLPRPMYVAPRVGPTSAALRSRAEGTGEEAQMVPDLTGQHRGAREYVPGDLRRSVHWPASAHTGSLMVRELERTSDRAHTVRVVLPDDAGAAETEAEQALGTVLDLLARGLCVFLVTTEVSGCRGETVGNPLEAGRRLAAAVPE